MRLNYTADCLLEVVTWQLHWALFFFSQVFRPVLQYYQTTDSISLISRSSLHLLLVIIHDGSYATAPPLTVGLLVPSQQLDGKRDTVTIVQKDQFVFGGYTDIPWGKPLTLAIYFLVMKRVLNKNISESLRLI